jgi:hypothetical protein
MSFPTNATDVVLAVFAAAFFTGISTAGAREPPAADAPQAPTPDATAAAQALFIEGRRLVNEGQYLEGCAKLEQSQRLDPAPGTQINLADCLEKSGKFASAWLTFHEASASAQRSGRADWAEQARARAGVVEPKVPRLTVVADEPVRGLVVRRNGLGIESSTLGSPVPVDPGSYEVVATAPGHRSWSTHVTVDASTHVVLHVPALAEEPTAPALPPPTAAPKPTASSGGSFQRPIAVGVAAGAVVTLGVASYFGVSAITHNDSAAALCPTSPACLDPRAVDLTRQAYQDARAANVAFIAGGVLLATGAVLFFMAPREAAHARLGVGVAGTAASLVGRF